MNAFSSRRMLREQRSVAKMKLAKTFEFRLWLQNEFAERAKRNPRYSLRAFAKLLQMEPTSVSQILSGKRRASTKVLTQRRQPNLQIHLSDTTREQEFPCFLSVAWASW
jgi:hypothetical protein